MAFSNLFSKLAAFGEDVKSPHRSGFTFRDGAENRGGAGMKRKTQDEQHGSYRKKSCYQFPETSASDAIRGSDSPFKRHQNRSAGSYCYPAGRAKGARTSQRSRPDHINKQSCSGQDYKSEKTTRNMGKKTERKEPRFRDRTIPQDKPRIMTQEFKDQNAFLVDGRLLCRHFIFGRCIKEDACQLLHVQGCNDMIKEVCKFYIQGFCQKGDSCIYMHKSFPCKFFHRKRRCLQEGNCRFSHDALNDVTKKLLDEAVKQEEEYYKARKEEKEEVEEETEANQNPDAPTELLRPTFYNSTDIVKETSCQSELSVPDFTEPHISPKVDPNHQEPVCYSVEAMLGPQLARSFSSFSKTPGSQESSEETASSSNQIEAPYSVEVVLRSYKPVQNTKPPCFSLLHNPRALSEADGDPQNEKSSQNDKDSANASQEIKSTSFVSSGVSADVISDASSDPNAQSVEISSQGVKLKLRPVVSEAEKSRTEEGMNQLTGTTSSTRCTFPPKHPDPPKPSCSLDADEFKGAAASVRPVTAPVGESLSANVGVHRFAAKQLTEILQNSKKKHCTDKPSASIVAPKSRRTSNQVGLGEAQKRPFIRHSADPLTGCAAPSAGSESLVKPERSANVRGSSSAFLGLFATRLSASDPSSQPQASRSALTASGLESFSSRLRSEDRQTPLRLISLTPRSLKSDDAAAKQTATPGSCRSEPSSGQAEPQPPDVPAPRETPNSVLKTLFLHLKPFQEDGEHQSCRQSFIHPGIEEETRSTEERQLKKRKQSNKEEGKKNDLSTEKTSLLRADLLSRSQTPQSEDPARSAVVRPGPTEPRATHSFPSEAATRHRGPGAKPTSEEGWAANRTAAVTPLRNLFKALGAFSPPM